MSAKEGDEENGPFPALPVPCTRRTTLSFPLKPFGQVIEDSIVLLLTENGASCGVRTVGWWRGFLMNQPRLERKEARGEGPTAASAREEIWRRRTAREGSILDLFLLEDRGVEERGRTWMSDLV